MSTLILILLLAQGRPPQRAPQPELKPEDYGRVEGTVSNAMTGEPIRRAEIRLSATERRGPEDSPSLTTTTDNAGRFSITKVAPGRFVVRPARNGFVQKGSTPVTVAKGQSVSNISITMLPQAVVTGRVIDDEGEPLARIGVTAYRYAYPQGRKTLVPEQTVSTNDLGEYRIWGLSRGTFYLVAMSHSNGGRPRSNDPEPLTATYHPAATTIEGATPVRLSPGSQMPNLDIQMRRSKTFTISGFVTDAATGQAASRASVSLQGEAGGLLGGGSRTMSREGQFSISGIVPGSYTLVARTFTEGRGQSTESAAGRVRVEVGNADISGVRIPMRQPETLQGIVKLDSGEAALASVRVQLEPLESGQYTPGTSGSGVKEDGKFAIASVAPIRYRLRVQNVPTGFYVKAIRHGNQDVHNIGIDAASGAGELTVLLAPGVGSVEGIVKDSKDQPQSQVTVVLVPKEAWQGLADTIRVATSGTDGKYQFAQVAPGEYELYAFEDAESGAWFDPDFRAMYRDQAKTVRVEKGAAAAMDLRAATTQ